MEGKKENFLKRAFKDMKENAKAQHQVDKANFVAAKAEAKAHFEENRGTNTYRRAKADAKKTWDEAHMSPAERTAKIRAEQADQIEEANARIQAANEKYEQLRAERKGTSSRK